MPTFENYEVQISDRIDIDFEVYCGTCGCGLCNVSDTRRSTARGYLQVTVDVCPDCMSKKDEEIRDLKDELNSLASKIEQLEDELNNVTLH